MVAYLTSIELRRHWRSTLLLALLVALVAGTVIASVAGAERSRTAMERYLAEVRTLDAAAFGDPEVLARLEGLEGVEAAPRMELLAAAFEIDPEGFYPLVVVEDGLAPYQYLRYPVVEGRQARPDAPSEIALGERTASRLGLGVGDTASILTYTGPTADDAFRYGDGRDQPEPDGPTIELTVVGIVRDSGDIAARENDITVTVLSPAFRDSYDADEVGILSDGHLVFLEEGASVADLGEQLAGSEVEVDTTLSAEGDRTTAQPTMNAIATALLAFAGVVALAGLVAFGQSLARAAQVAADDDHTLGALGVQRRVRWLRLAAPGAIAVAAGTPVGVLVAIAASPVFPVGLARRAEPSNGIDVDAPVLALGALGALVLGGGLVAVLSARQVRRTRLADAGAPVGLAGRVAADAGAPSPVVSGLSLVSGTPGAPGRAAVAGVLVGALGVIAALTFGASIDHLKGDPHLYGWDWDLAIEGADLSDLPTDAFDPEVLLDDEDVAAAGRFASEIPVVLDGQPEYAMSITDVKGHLGPVIVSGRAPRSASEIALAGKTLRKLDADVGDTIDVQADGPSLSMVITGVVALPVPEDGGSSARGAWLPQDAAEQLGFSGACDISQSCTNSIAVRVRDGADPAAVGARYADEEAEIAFSLPAPSGELTRLTAVEGLPRYLAVFLAVLAGAAVSFAVSTTLRRRRADLAILRTLGMTTRQLRTVVGSLVIGLTASGAIVGTVLGVIVGRQVWRAVADSVSLPFAPTVPAIALALVPIGTIVLAHLVATSARHRAGHTPAAVLLRAE